MVEGRSKAAFKTWLADRDDAFRDAVDRCRRRVQLAIHGHRGFRDDPLYKSRRTLHTGADLFTDKQSDRLRALFVDDATEALNGRLEHLRGSALGFRNLTNYIARSLLETGGFRPQLLHPRLG